MSLVRVDSRSSPLTEHMDISVRSFCSRHHSSADIARLHLCVRQAQQKEGENRFMDVASSQEDLGDIPTNYQSDGGEFFVATNADNTIVGFVAVQRDEREPQTCLLRRLAVIPNARHQGVGSRLCERATQWAESHGFTTIRLATGNKERALGIYWRAGFTVIGYDSERDDILMERACPHL